MKLSIALTTYNGARYLAAQLASFVAQSRQPDELVVCDEHSADTTAQILADFQATAPFPVRIVINETRLGIIANFEQAVSLCTGDVVFLSDQDDSWHADKLARHEAIYQASPDVGLIFSDAAVVGTQLEPLGLRMNQQLGITPDRLAQLSGARVLELLVRRPFLLGCTLSFRAELRRFLHPFPTNQLHDNWIPFALATVTRFQGIADPLIDYRSHGQQSVGVNDLRNDQPGRSQRTRVEEFDHQLDLLRTLVDHVQSFRDEVIVADFERVIQAKQAYLNRRRRAAVGNLLTRASLIARDLIAGGYLKYASYPKHDLIGDIKRS